MKPEIKKAFDTLYRTFAFDDSAVVALITKIEDYVKELESYSKSFRKG